MLVLPVTRVNNLCHNGKHRMTQPCPNPLQSASGSSSTSSQTGSGASASTSGLKQPTAAKWNLSPEQMLAVELEVMAPTLALIGYRLYEVAGVTLFPLQSDDGIQRFQVVIEQIPLRSA